MTRPEKAWLAVAGAIAAADFALDRGEPNGDTLSECLRRWFRTESPGGRAAFAVALAAGSHFLYAHIAKDPAR